MEMKDQVANLKAASPYLAAKSEPERNDALKAVAIALMDNKEAIMQANQKDLVQAEADGIGSAIIKRLKFDENKLNDVVSGIEELIKLPDPLNHIQFARELDEGLHLYRQTCPIGVIGVIFESRPDALVQIASLCIKSGNCAILKGGSEAMHTNRILFRTIHEACVKAGLPEGCMMQAEQRSEINELLSYHEYVDLLIPRGSNSFVQYIMNNTKIPVMGHADGICHIYVDKTADVTKAIPIIVDSKTQYVAACNAVETLLIHKDIADSLLPALREAFNKANVTLKGTKEIQSIVDCEEAEELDFKTEYLDLIISAKLVDSVEEAIDHINHYGSHHTDSIISEDKVAVETFMQLVDSSGVYHNCSTRFADGFKYGLGAEVGISTGKIHSRGPVGLDGLVTYKYKLYGDGHIVADYAEKKKTFHFKNL